MVCNCYIYCGNLLSYFKMKKINLAITGCMGRMGRQIIRSTKFYKSFKIVSLTENKEIRKKINGIKINLNTEG